ncbi:MAG: T9SS type A sorting domain-containing protein [bacterium]
MTKQFKPALFVLVAVFLIASSTKSFCEKSDKIQLQDTSSGWIPKDGYWEQKLKVGEITFLQYSKDGEHFYTFGMDNIFRKWENESGLLVDEFKIPLSCTNISISPDESRMVISYHINKEFEPNCDSIKVFDLNLKKEVKHINPLINYGFSDDKWLDYSNNLVIFDTDTTILIIVNMRLVTGNGRDNDNQTRILIWNFANDTIQHSLTRKNCEITTIKQSKDKKYFLYCNNYFNSGTYPGTGGNVSYFDEVSEIILIDSDYKAVKNYYRNTGSGDEDPDNGIYYQRISRMLNSFFSNNLNYVIGIFDQNEIYIWDFTTNTLINHFSFGAKSNEQFPNDIISSYNDKYIITGANDGMNGSAIKFLNIPSGVVMESIKFNNRNNNWKLALTPDSIGLLTGSKDGILRLFYPSVLKIENENDVNTQSTIIPNPNLGTGIIKFHTEHDGNVQIKLYSITGVEQAVLVSDFFVSGYHEIPFNLNNFSQGIYFYTISINGKFLSSGKLVIVE